MTRFSGKVGYGATVESSPGVHRDVITEISYFGDVIKNTVAAKEGVSVNDDITVNNIISIVADEYANGHFMNIRYVEWAGNLWKVTNVDIQRPRLLLSIGGVYNGPKPATP